MSWSDKTTLRVAVLDMYEGVENQGMRGIREIINQFAEVNGFDLVKDEYDVRRTAEVPDLSYDIYISTGGPGDPWDGEGREWENKFFDFITQVLAYNNDDENVVKKHLFFICHSFQLASRYFKTGEVKKRNSTSFGVFPMHYLSGANNEPVFRGLLDPFYAVDSRDYQVVKPDHAQIAKIGGKILAIEKARPHVPYERAVMAVRFNKYMIGTQFHPEADAIGMLIHLQTEEKKKTVIANYGQAKWENMIEHLNDPDKIMHTHDHILPNFLKLAIGKFEFAELL